MSTFSGKVTSRRITQVTGSLLYDITVETPAAKAGDPAVVKTYKAQLTPSQLATYNLIGEQAPKIGASVVVEQSVNPSTGQVSPDWVSICG